MQTLLNTIREGKRLDRDQALHLYRHADLHDLGELAHDIRLAKHPEPVVTYVADRNINYSNICSCGCRFCAFFKAPGQAGGYVIEHDELAEKIEETLALGGTQILMQGGHHPELPFSFYEELLQFIGSNYPSIHVHAFSPPEIFYFSKLYNMNVATIIERLRRAGLHSIPGGGAEILVNSVREQVSPNKCTADEWLAVMEEAHNQGLRTTATMMFGHEESVEDRIDHLLAIRDLQDRTRGFTAFIPWTFQPENTNIAARPATAPEYLRLLALSRIVLDNVENLQVSWVTMGPKIAQLALYFGGNDFGSLMIEENVVKAAGVSFRLTRQEINRLIKRAGFRPVQRNMVYQPVEQPA
ncbi:de-hypoxanthine futalosine cyclase [Paucidesulfovibrio gracilis DSM 16080]|uniref:Cyclic dehypoxanthine futalosine synthase n=1 Tax=Paucidesulfovibrio gracilis DSM 16080 TaxID=1121449 RepID=A0A1T4WBZ2_9BACT|nr:cyclic dehypoxanthinyl futalosine synthase [Paucidesulfovibrio gracilis]SKA74803.1 de-hypoxanthine futalosine cyclase [Paucidesulfovibrio gracilis DSM 16080]